MKALTIHQPWANAIIDGAKDIENRTWPTRYRGWLLIHVGKTYDDTAASFCHDLDYHRTRRPDCLQSRILGAAYISDCIPHHRCKSPWAFGPWCWVITDAVNFNEGLFLNLSGRLGLWEPPYDHTWWLDYIRRLQGHPPPAPAPAPTPQPPAPPLHQPELPGLAPSESAHAPHSPAPHPGPPALRR